MNWFAIHRRQIELGVILASLAGFWFAFALIVRWVLL